MNIYENKKNKLNSTPFLFPKVGDNPIKKKRT